MLPTDRRTETDNTTTLVATRLKYNPTSKVDVQQQMLGLACVSKPVKLCFLSIHSTLSVVLGRCRSHSTPTHFIESTKSSLTFVNSKWP